MCPTITFFSAAMAREDLVFAIQLELVDSLHRCQSSTRRAHPGHKSNVALTNPNNQPGCDSINNYGFMFIYIYIYIIVYDISYCSKYII